MSRGLPASWGKTFAEGLSGGESGVELQMQNNKGGMSNLLLNFRELCNREGLGLRLISDTAI